MKRATRFLLRCNAGKRYNRYMADGMFPVRREDFVAWLRALPLKEPLPQPAGLWHGVPARYCPLECFLGRKGDYTQECKEDWQVQLVVWADDRDKDGNIMHRRWLALTPHDCLVFLGEAP